MLGWYWDRDRWGWEKVSINSHQGSSCFVYSVSNLLSLSSFLFSSPSLPFSTHFLSHTYTLCNQQMSLPDSPGRTNCADACLAVSSNLALPTQTHGALKQGNQLKLHPPTPPDTRRVTWTDAALTCAVCWRAQVFLKATALSIHLTGPNVPSTPSIKCVKVTKPWCVSH